MRKLQKHKRRRIEFQLSAISVLDTPPFLTHQAGKHYRKGRLSTVDLLSKKFYFVKKEINSFDMKSS
jgi:hypothetical protein